MLRDISFYRYRNINLCLLSDNEGLEFSRFQRYTLQWFASRILLFRAAPFWGDLGLTLFSIEPSKERWQIGWRWTISDKPLFFHRQLIPGRFGSLLSVTGFEWINKVRWQKYFENSAKQQRRATVSSARKWLIFTARCSNLISFMLKSCASTPFYCYNYSQPSRVFGANFELFVDSARSMVLDRMSSTFLIANCDSRQWIGKKLLKFKCKKLMRNLR